MWEGPAHFSSPLSGAEAGCCWGLVRQRCSCRMSRVWTGLGTRTWLPVLSLAQGWMHCEVERPAGQGPALRAEARGS